MDRVTVDSLVTGIGVIIVAVAYWWFGFQVGLSHAEQTDTVYVSPTPTYVQGERQRIANKLRDGRWSCEYGGCLDSADIDRLADVILHSSDHPELMVGLIRTENPWLDSTRVSGADAVGLTQVVPRYWAGRWPECADLNTVQGSVCTGARVLERYLAVHGDTTQALLAYNGCMPGWECDDYPRLVLGRGYGE